MIFVCVGSREYPFDRLLKKLDELVAAKRIPSDVFAQIGQSTYIPASFPCLRFLDAAEFERRQRLADLIISHAGTGALVGALKMGKQVIAVPRLRQYGEHLDDHQIEVAQALCSQGYLRCVLDINDLETAVREAFDNPVTKRFESASGVLSIIEAFIRSN